MRRLDVVDLNLSACVEEVDPAAAVMAEGRVTERRVLAVSVGQSASTVVRDGGTRNCPDVLVCPDADAVISGDDGVRERRGDVPTGRVIL